MPSRTFARLLLAAIVVAVPVPLGRAEPVRWSYLSVVHPWVLLPGTGTGTPPFDPFFSSPAPRISLSGNISGELVGSSPVRPAFVYAAGWFEPGDVATFQQSPFQVEMVITDHASGAYGTAVFHSFVDGAMTSQGPNLTFTIPESTKTLHLGQRAYTISLGGATLTGPWAAGEPLGSSAPIHSYSGAIDGTVQVSELASNTPEPSTLVLVAAAGSAASLLYLRRRKPAGPGATG